MEVAVILERLGNIEKSINEKLDGVHERLDRLNGKVAEHERWIAERAAIDRLMQSLAESVAEHQTYIDQRQADLRDFLDMKKTLAAHTQYIEQQKGGHRAAMQMVSTVCSLVGALGIIVGLLIKLWSH